VIPIRLPSLRERREDIRALALHFVSRANQAHQRNVNLTTDALARLETHDWPGNIRELGNLIERLVLLADHTRVDSADLERFMPKASAAPPSSSEPAGLPPASGQPLVRDYGSARSHSVETLQTALAHHQGHQSRAAQSLGLTLRQFSYRLRKAGLR
jgi:Nif-specific regulatory protein